MVKALKTYVRIVEKITAGLGALAAWLTTALVLLICYDVFMRYVFATTSALVLELEWHLFAAIFLVGAAYGLQKDKHVRVDVFYAGFTPKKKAWINLVGTLLFLLPLCYVVIITSARFSYNSFLMQEGSADPGGLPNRFIIKCTITLGFLLLLLQALAQAARSALVLLNQPFDNAHNPLPPTE